MLTQQTQDKVLRLIATDLSFISKFKEEGLALKNDYFTEDNIRQFELLKKAKQEGFTEITDKFKEEYNLKTFEPFEKKRTVNDFLDLAIDVRKELTHKNKKVAKRLIGEAFKAYEGSTKENEVEAIENLRNSLAKIQTTEFKDNTKTLYEIIEEDMVCEESKDLIRTYLTEVDDNILKGGYERSAIHIVSGFPGNGKTTLGVQIITLQAMNGYKVLFLSLEQKKIKILQNILSVASEEEEKNRSYWNVSKKKTANEMFDLKRDTNQIVSERIRDNIHIDDTRWDTQENFIERVRRACLVEKYDVVVIDNFQNAPKPKEFLQVESAYSNLADELLTIALASNTAILALSQLTMSNGYEKTKYSARLNEHAVSNIKIELVSENSSDGEILKSKLTALKARSGEQGREETLAFNGEKSIIGSFVMPKINKEEQSRYEMDVSYKHTGLPF